MRAHQRAGVGQRRVGADGHRVDHHAGFELLDLADLLGLLGRRQVAVDDADAAGLRHGDGQPRFGDRVHRRRQDRRRQLDVAGDARGDVGLARHDFGMAGLQQHVVEGQRQCAGRGLDDLCHGQSPDKCKWRGPMRTAPTRDVPFRIGTGWYHESAGDGKATLKAAAANRLVRSRRRAVGLRLPAAPFSRQSCAEIRRWR